MIARKERIARELDNALRVKKNTRTTAIQPSVKKRTQQKDLYILYRNDGSTLRCLVCEYQYDETNALCWAKRELATLKTLYPDMQRAELWCSMPHGGEYMVQGFYRKD